LINQLKKNYAKHKVIKPPAAYARHGSSALSKQSATFGMQGGLIK
jgi:hypothetical protein